MDAHAWDDRYREADLIWSAGPNALLVDEVEDLPTGRALDIACGEGRNALWLAEQGWDVTGADFSPVAIEKARAIAARRGLDVDFRVTDATAEQPGGQDLVIVFYLHLPAEQRRQAHRRAAEALAAGGELLVVGHDLDNLDRGVGGPQSAEVLLTAAQVVADLDGTGLTIVRAEQVERTVGRDDGPPSVAIDTIVRARAPA